MDLEKIANLIKTKRKEKNLTQEELASKLNVTEKAISRWETGRGTPDISLLIPLSKELDLEVSELLSGKEKKKCIKDEIEKVIEYEEYNKKNKNKRPLIISIIIYIVFLLLYLLYLKEIYHYYSYEPNYIAHIIVNAFFSILVIIANWILYTYYFDKVTDKKKMKKITYGIILIIYMIMVLNLTIFGRQMFWFSFLKNKDYFKYGGLNLIPFATIYEYLSEFKRFTRYTFMVNTIGNLVIFMPVQFLLMKIIDNWSFKKYLRIDLIGLLLIETLQLLSGCGVFDIDDIILNLLGMMIVYFVIKRWKKEDKKNL